MSIHRLVAEAYLDNPENKRTVNHLDMNKHNNHVSNLEWATYKENHTHAIANGVRIGEKNGNSKLTEDDILEIRGKYKFRKYTYAMLSNDYKVGKVYIGRIINRKVWKHI